MQTTNVSSVARAKTAAAASVKAKSERGDCYRNPATSNRDYSREETEFLRATEEFKQKTNKKYLTRTDYFQVMLDLGYIRAGIFA